MKLRSLFGSSVMASSSRDACDDEKPLLVFHQCMRKEWRRWGRDSAREMAAQGFAVIHVESCQWQVLKESDPNAFRNPYKANETQQQMICTIVMRDITCVMMQDVVQRMRDGVLPADLREWKTTEFAFELPLGDAPCMPDLTIVAVTEASALMGRNVSPRVVRCLWESYGERLLWAGFNSKARVSGSKLLVGAPEDFQLLRIVLERLKVWHIDQQYKSFQNSWFSVVRSQLRRGTLQSSNAFDTYQRLWGGLRGEPGVVPFSFECFFFIIVSCLFLSGVPGGVPRGAPRGDSREGSPGRDPPRSPRCSGSILGCPGRYWLDFGSIPGGFWDDVGSILRRFWVDSSGVVCVSSALPRASGWISLSATGIM